MSVEPSTSRRWSRVAIAVLGVGALVTTTAGWVEAAGHARKIHGCVGHGGALRIASQCSSSERGITWNKLGPVGPRGPAGVAQGFAGRYLARKTALALKATNATLTATPPLAKGTYLVNASINLTMYAGDGATCRIVSAMGNGSVGTQHAEAQTPPDAATWRTDLSISAVIVRAARNDELSLVCRDYRAGSKPSTVSNAEINAVEVNALTIRKDAS
jgi:hypothetical protein